MNFDTWGNTFYHLFFGLWGYLETLDKQLIQIVLSDDVSQTRYSKFNEGSVKIDAQDIVRDHRVNNSER